MRPRTVYAPRRAPVTGVRRVTAAADLRHRLLDLILPAHCLACARRDPGRPLALGLCLPCRGRLARWPRACATCARPIPGAVPPGYRCGRCRRRPPPFERLLCLWQYRPPLDAVIAGLKFGRLDYLGDELGAALGAFVAPRLGRPGGAAAVDVVVPVPLHWWRRLRRGYDQATLIARASAATLRLPSAMALRRRRATVPQSRLARRARLRGPRDAFTAVAAACAGRDVLLIDDVATTGATLRAAATCLRRAGARKVVAAVVAATPEPGADRKRSRDLLA